MSFMTIQVFFKKKDFSDTWIIIGLVEVCGEDFQVGNNLTLVS